MKQIDIKSRVKTFEDEFKYWHDRIKKIYYDKPLITYKKFLNSDSTTIIRQKNNFK